MSEPSWRLLLPEAPDGRITYLLCEPGEGERVFALLTPPRPALCAVSFPDWFADLSPWPAPKVFAKGDDFAGHGEASLAALLDLLPEAEKPLAGLPVRRMLCGYSLAGLFALWAATRTDAFPYLGSFSGSLWYPGAEDLGARLAAARPMAVSLSLGDREKNARQRQMATVEERTLAVRDALTAAGIPTAWTLHPGGHFNDPDGRTARGIDEGWRLAER